MYRELITWQSCEILILLETSSLPLEDLWWDSMTSSKSTSRETNCPLSRSVQGDDICRSLYQRVWDLSAGPPRVVYTSLFPPQDLVHLCSLPKLHTLSLCEKLYPPNPLCELCNYSTHTLYHLPALQWLDGTDVSSPELHRLIQVQ